MPSSCVFYCILLTCCVFEGDVIHWFCSEVIVCWKSRIKHSKWWSGMNNNCWRMGFVYLFLKSNLKLLSMRNLTTVESLLLLNGNGCESRRIRRDIISRTISTTALFLRFNLQIRKVCTRIDAGYTPLFLKRSNGRISAKSRNWFCTRQKKC